MNRIFRIVTTALLAVGFAYLFLYLGLRDAMRFSLLDKPSYALTFGARCLLYAGIITVIITLFGCFFSWFKKMDTPKKELPNAINARSGEIDTWVSGSTLGENTETLTEVLLEETDKTEVLGKETEIAENTTEIVRKKEEKDEAE